MPNIVAGYLWPSAKNYAAWRRACADRMEPTHAQWVARNRRNLEQVTARGLDVMLIDVDVADLVRWCRTRGTPVDSQARQLYAAQWMLTHHKRDGTDAG